MAEIAVSLLSGVVRAALETLKEALQLQGARGLDLERSASGDTPLQQVPELQLNICMVSELFVQILATGLGALVLVWATVVLLGGFSTSLQKADFWVITAIVFIQTARVVGINVSPEAEFFNQVPPAFLELGAEHHTAWGRRRPLTGQATGKNFIYYVMLALGSARDFITIMAFLAVLVPAVPMIAGLGCISLPIYRLVALLSRHHDNVFDALILFYALVLLQGGLFIIWLSLRLYRSYIANRLSVEYGLEARRELIDRYIDRTLSTAIKNGVSSTINKTLASFATDLMKSDYSQDRIDAVLVIHTLTSQEYHRTRTLSQIQYSPLFVSRLLDMVTSKSRTDQRTQLCIAEIVEHLASNLRLADISGGTESISSMIDPYFNKMSTPATNVNIDHQTAIDITTDRQGAIQSSSTTITPPPDGPSTQHGGAGTQPPPNVGENIGLCTSVEQSMKRGLDWSKKLREQSMERGLDWWKKLIEHIITNGQQGTLRSSTTTGGAESKPLIIQGLLILAKLAVNPENCKQIYDSKVLFVKIISPVKNNMYQIPSDDGITMEITEKALEVVSTLVSGTDETNGMIRRDICSNGIAVNNIRPILEREHMYNKLKVPATKILTELYLDMATRATIGLDDIVEFIKILMNIFLDVGNESGLRKTAGKALAVLAMDNANCTTIMNFSTGTETSAVQLLTSMIPEANNRLYQTAIAQLLMQFSANPDSSAERERLEPVKTILHEVLRVICNVEQAENTNQAGSPQHSPGDQQQAANANQAGSPQHNLGLPPLLTLTLHRLNSFLSPRRSHAANRNAPVDNLPAVPQLVGGRRKSLAAFLGLAMQICNDQNISADDFDTALARIPLSMGEFVDKLNDIIEQCKGHSADSFERKRPSVDYLIIIKTVTKLCTWMMRIKPDCITEFQNKNTSTKLQGALEDMRDLELGMLLTGRAGDMANYETLSTIVAAARECTKGDGC